MDWHDYKLISKMYDEKTFKIQLVVTGIFYSGILLSFPISELLMENTQINYNFFSMMRTLAFIIWFSICSRLEKKEIFIPWNYYRIVSFRVCYVIVFFILGFIFLDSEKSFFLILLLALIYIPIEIYSSHKEYITFKMKMDKVRH